MSRTRSAKISSIGVGTSASLRADEEMARISMASVRHRRRASRRRLENSRFERKILQRFFKNRGPCVLLILVLQRALRDLCVRDIAPMRWPFAPRVGAVCSVCRERHSLASWVCAIPPEVKSSLAPKRQKRPSPQEVWGGSTIRVRGV